MERTYPYQSGVTGIECLTSGIASIATDISISEDTNDVKRIDNPHDELPSDGEAPDDITEAEQNAVVVTSVDGEVFKLRSYQDEMVKESLKRNTIVVLNTGAGKTHM